MTDPTPFAVCAVQGSNTAVAVRNPYLRVVGMETDAEGAGRSGKRSFTPSEEAAMHELSRRPDIYERFARSIAPSIFGFDGASSKMFPAAPHERSS